MAIMEMWKAEAEAMQTAANVKTRIVICGGVCDLIGREGGRRETRTGKMRTNNVAASLQLSLGVVKPASSTTRHISTHGTLSAGLSCGTGCVVPGLRCLV